MTPKSHAETIKTFLLIHGGSHGAWCWEAVIRELHRLGHKAFAPDLPGAGDDPTPRAKITFDSYLQAVNAFIEAEGLDDFILVGHSLAGIILPEIAAANRGKVRGAVFVAAFTLDQGERAIDLIAPERVPDYYRIAGASAERSLMLDYRTARRRFFSDLGDDAAHSAYARLTPQPLAPYLEPARHAAHTLHAVSRYIICSNDRNLLPDTCLGYAEKLGGAVREIKAGHDVMLSKPAELAALLTGESKSR